MERKSRSSSRRVYFILAGASQARGSARAGGLRLTTSQVTKPAPAQTARRRDGPGHADRLG